MIANDVVTMSYASDRGVTVANDEVLFTITVKADRAVKVSEMLSIGSAVTPAEGQSKLRSKNCTSNGDLIDAKRA